MTNAAAKRKCKPEGALPAVKHRKTMASPSPVPDGDGRLGDGDTEIVAARRVRGAVGLSGLGVSGLGVSGLGVSGLGVSGLGLLGRGEEGGCVDEQTCVGERSRLDDEYDEDVGRTESQTFLKLVRFEAKKKGKMGKENRVFMERFEKGVAERRAELMLALTEGKKAASERDSQFLESFEGVYGVSRSYGTDPTQGFAANYEKSREIVTMALSLVSKFEEVAKRVERIDVSALLENEWGAKDDQFKALLSMGKDIGVERYRRMLNASKEKLVLEGNAKEVEGALFKGAREGKWGDVVRKQQKAMKKLVKTVEVA